MKIPFVPADTVKTLKTNLSDYAVYFKQSDNKQLQENLQETLFLDTKYDLPESILHLKTDDKRPESTDFENVKIVYDSLKFLTDSQASDERLWAGLCLGPCWSYVQKRWDLKKNCTPNNIEQHFLFAYAARRSLTRNAIARLWWIGRLTYNQKSASGNPYEYTEYVCKKSRYIVDFLERNLSNSPEILQEFLRASRDAENNGAKIDSNRARDLVKYLDVLGGAYLLDAMPKDAIYKKIYAVAMK